MRISDWSSDVCSSDLQVGALAFTPGNIKQDEVREGDRPYASLLYVANGRSYVRDAGRTVYHTRLSVGLLGDRKRVVSGKSVSVRVDLGGRRIIKKKDTRIRSNT